MPRSGVTDEPFPSPCMGDLRVPACLLLARIDGRSPTSTDQWLLSSAVHYDRSWPLTAETASHPENRLCNRVLSLRNGPCTRSNQVRYFIGIGVDRSTAMAVTLFCGE